MTDTELTIDQLKDIHRRIEKLEGEYLEAKSTLRSALQSANQITTTIDGYPDTSDSWQIQKALREIIGKLVLEQS